MKIVSILIVALTLACASCTSMGSSAPHQTMKCICGTPEADFNGCPNEVCAKGQRNPDNPDCVCGPMKIGGK
jgi:hypothetical protein